MENTSKSKVNSNNQGSGGITAQNVTINNYGTWSKGIGSISFLFKSKAVKYSCIGVIAIGLVFSATRAFSTRAISPDEFYKFLLAYLQNIEEKNTDARDYFANNISIFYLEKNITPEKVNILRKTMDFVDSRFDIDKQSIHLDRIEEGIQYWRFKSGMICYRPKTKRFQKCKVEMEYGINGENKITSIDQLKVWNLKYTRERPEW